MNIRSKAEKKEVDMTPMIDITFLLIAFFMMTVSFAQEDQNERIRLPASELARPSEIAPKQRITLQITKDGTVFLGPKEYTLEQLRKALAFEASFFRAIRVNIRDVDVILRGDEYSETGKIQDVMQICQEIGLEVFRLRAKQEEY